jgi:acetyl-CoA C-acetyltransferase
MEEPVIVGYLRTPFSRSRPQNPERDVFSKIRGDELMAILLKEIVEKFGVEKKEIDEIILGCALSVWENWMYGGKTASLLAELPVEISCLGVDKQCGSSMAAIHIGAMEIMTGNAEIVIAGGYEHMTRVPMGMYNPHMSVNMRLAEDERYKKYEMEIGFVMGLTAEKLFKEAGYLTKEDLDRWALRSHQLATKALEEGYFRDEIMPVEVESPDGGRKIIDMDQSIRPDTTLEKISSLPPAFIEGGVITAGNSSPLNAGATATILMSRKKAAEYGMDPLARIKSMASAGVPPSVMGKGPVPASKKALERANLSVKDIDYWEINEAFAVVTLYAVHELGIEAERVNVKGGAIAIGHPLGATGARLVGTLARILQREGGDYGLATACIGGGQGIATVIEKA